MKANMNLNNLFNNKESFDKELRTGTLLIASPLLKESYFMRSVIALIDIDPNHGCLGLSLNKLTNLNMYDIFNDQPFLKKVPVYCGGPVDAGRLFMLHRLGTVISGSVEIADGLFLGNNFRDAFSYLSLGGKVEGEIRFFLGYSGWTTGQLEKEVLQQAWAVNDTPTTSSLLTDNEEVFWRQQVRCLGESFRPWLLLPEDPNEN